MFKDRLDAGERLAQRLGHLAGENVVVVGLPRGGVPVAYQVARALHAPLDVIVVRKLGVPFQPELGMGAIGEGGVRILNDQVVSMAGVDRDDIAAVESRERAELDRRASRFRRGRDRVALAGQTVIVVDDGIATGSTARAACQVARAQGAERVVLAVPVAPADWTARLGADADELVCVSTPEPFYAIGQFYRDFSQTSDDEVVECLDRAEGRGLDVPRVAGSAVDSVRDEDVVVPVGAVRLAGRLTIPPAATGVVVFAHGSGSSRHSPRNRFVAEVLLRAGIGTLLFDLLTEHEELDRANVFDIELLAGRLVAVGDWLRTQPGATDKPIGFFGSSTGAGAALWAAADDRVGVAAVVSRGGRPDLAGPHLSKVTAPTLLIVGGYDDVVLDLNRQAQSQLRCENRLEVVAGATHLFEEPGTLDRAAELARDWFLTHLAGRAGPRGNA